MNLPTTIENTAEPFLNASFGRGRATYIYALKQGEHPLLIDLQTLSRSLTNTAHIDRATLSRNIQIQLAQEAKHQFTGWTNEDLSKMYKALDLLTSLNPYFDLPQGVQEGLAVWRSKATQAVPIEVVQKIMHAQIPFELSPEGEDLLVLAKKLSDEQRNLFEEYRLLGTFDSDSGVYTSTGAAIHEAGRGYNYGMCRGVYEQDVYFKLIAPKNTEHPLSLVWEELKQRAELIAAEQLQELAELPWYPTPEEYLLCDAYRCSALVYSHMLTPEQRALLEKCAVRLVRTQEDQEGRICYGYRGEISPTVKRYSPEPIADEYAP